ncbi:uncharacterized protein LOC143057477 [Mytilus galloprovincialis]|uniref:uncharacterized protein LOC143057477 n=1 Tax=Mytilus galloprovincialis TaxID=29158 RepID=UPI003F7B61EC
MPEIQLCCDLGNNRIVTLDVNLFKGLTALEKLYMQNNRIVTLDVNLFNGLTALMELKLENNPLNCSMCMMKKIKDFLQRNNDFGNSGARCEGEANLLIDQNFTNCKDSFSPPETECTTGIMNAVVIILVSCGAGILPFFCIVYCCAHKKGKRANINQNVNNHGNNADRNEEISQNLLTEKESDEEYAEIDELEVSDLIVSPLEQRYFTDSDSSSENASDEIKLSSIGYSHPTLLHRNEEISQNMLTEKESDEEYAKIDELEVSDLIVSPLEQRCFTDSDSSSDNASDEIKLSSFGYSHPTLLPAPQQSGNVQGDSDAC